MALRVDQLTIPPGSPIGACSLPGLGAFDLVLITGKNGSGKTSLLSPLDMPGPTTGTVTCLNSENARESYTGAIARAAQRQVTFVRSRQLLAKFEDLSQALGLAADTVRLQREARLLRQLARQAKGTETVEIPGEPRQITDRKHAFLAADRACGIRPRTVAEYNRMGAALAHRAHVEWAYQLPGGATMERIDAENAIRPIPRKLDGLFELSNAISRLPAHMAGPNPPQSAAARSEAAKLTLVFSLEQAIGVIPPNARPNPQTQDLAAEADAVIAALTSASRSMQAALEAKDALGQCRSIASGYLQAQSRRGVAVDSCPVCAQPIDPAQVGARLEATTGGNDPEADGWRTAKAGFDALIGQIKTNRSAWSSASSQAAAEHAEIKTPIGNCAAALQALVAQHADSVTAARRAVHQRCTTWLADFGNSAPSSAAVTQAREVVAFARQSQTELQREEQALNDGLVQAQQEFAEFQTLGTALAARALLDEARWDLAIDQVQSVARRTAQRDRWIAVLNRMADVRETKARSAQATVVNDPGVQARFTALVSRIQHPALQSLRYQGSTVVREGTPVQDNLSEGQTALVNIAAAVAVAGKVADSPDHKPGWIAFDEPTNGLDEDARRQVAEFLGGMTVQDLPCQVFVATFDEDFAQRLRNAARAAGRRVGHVPLPPLQAGGNCTLRIEDFLP
jgi:ABC-type lipoprotein export system ATPase subunit